MATETHLHAPASGSLLDYRHRITVDQYHRMLDLGILGPDPRTELLGGVIVIKATKSPPHVLATELLEGLLHRIMPAGYFPSMGNPTCIAERDSEPEPDAQVIRGSPRDYAGRCRGSRDAALVIVVADASYDYDRYEKWVTYAGAGIPVYWILDLNRRHLEVHTGPEGQGEEARYRDARLLGPDEEVALVLDGREAARFLVREILP
ncbi:MAG: Uma2 family endonuclease [Isosphaeraceae bacterium]|nr:Uma2 family endonuclease [Isosphaeraceae bacterium]